MFIKTIIRKCEHWSGNINYHTLITYLRRRLRQPSQSHGCKLGVHQSRPKADASTEVPGLIEWKTFPSAISQLNTWQIECKQNNKYSKTNYIRRRLHTKCRITILGQTKQRRLRMKIECIPFVHGYGRGWEIMMVKGRINHTKSRRIGRDAAIRSCLCTTYSVEAQLRNQSKSMHMLSSNSISFHSFTAWYINTWWWFECLIPPKLNLIQKKQ